jgi:hypothetical protein
MSTQRNQTRHRHAAHSGVRVAYRCHITPDHLIAAGFVRDANQGDDRDARRTAGEREIVPDIHRFCRAIGYTPNAYHQIRRGTRNATDNFRVRVSRALNVDESQLFERVIEGG